jgi:signal transduction histidine kinase
MRERAEELHGTLTIASVPERGTTVEVVVPAEQPYRRAIPA